MLLSTSMKYLHSSIKMNSFSRRLLLYFTWLSTSQTYLKCPQTGLFCLLVQNKLQKLRVKGLKNSRHTMSIEFDLKTGIVIVVFLLQCSNNVLDFTNSQSVIENKF